MRTLEQLQKDLPVDKNALDDELLRQAQTFWEVAESYVESASKRDTAKHIAEKLAAELANQFRSSGEKITEARIEQYVESHPSYIEQKKFFLHYKAEADHWLALRDAYAQRSSMLRDLVSLYSTGYFGSGLTGGDSSLIQSYKQHYQNRSHSSKLEE